LYPFCRSVRYQVARRFEFLYATAAISDSCLDVVISTFPRFMAGAVLSIQDAPDFNEPAKLVRGFASGD